jgi:hypothetical protein
MLRETKVVLLTLLIVVFGYLGYFVLRIDCVSYLVIRPCDFVGATIGVFFWGIAFVLAVFVKRLGWKSDES